MINYFNISALASSKYAEYYSTDNGSPSASSLRKLRFYYPTFCLKIDDDDDDDDNDDNDDDDDNNGNHDDDDDDR
jgi:hypothetical protein